jgi:hypothetical protein
MIVALLAQRFRPYACSSCDNAGRNLEESFAGMDTESVVCFGTRNYQYSCVLGKLPDH